MFLSFPNAWLNVFAFDCVWLAPELGFGELERLLFAEDEREVASVGKAGGNRRFTNS
jgi:hypothetical protein